VVVDEFSTGCFNDSASIGCGVVRLAFAQSDSLGHCRDSSCGMVKSQQKGGRK